jgi:hypothetical protein
VHERFKIVAEVLNFVHIHFSKLVCLKLLNVHHIAAHFRVLVIVVPGNKTTRLAPFCSTRLGLVLWSQTSFYPHKRWGYRGNGASYTFSTSKRGLCWSYMNNQAARLAESLEVRL